MASKRWSVQTRSLTEQSVSVIRFVNETDGCDLSMVDEAVRPYAFRSYQQQEVAILVSDMSGFTRLTRKYGAIHFTSIIARTRQLCLPVFHKFGAILITAEGDSFNVVFPTAEGAVLAALDMRRLTNEYNKSLPEARAHFALTLNGVGVDFGTGPILDREGKLHGDTFANAHLLGEELCSKGCVAISRACHEKIRSASSFSDASFRPMSLPDNEDGREACEAMGSIFELDMRSSDPVSLPPWDVAGRLQETLLPLCRRHSPDITDAELEALDAELASKFMQKKVAMMLDFEFFDVDTPSACLGLKFACLSRLENILREHNAHKLEDVLYLFDDPVDAVLSATKVRDDVAKFREEAGEGVAQVGIKGFGVHAGEILLIEGTDVHWGDPVNTSSKLGQDFASNGDIIISKPTYDSCSSDPRLEDLVFEQIEVEISGVKFTPYKVTSKQPSGGHRLLNKQRTFSYTESPALDHGHRASSMHFKSCQSPSDKRKKQIIAACLARGFTSDTPVRCEVISEVMKVLAADIADDWVVEMIRLAQQQDPASDCLTLPAFIEWAFADS